MASIAEPPPAFRFHIPKLFSLSEKCRLKKVYSKLRKTKHKLNEIIYVQFHQNINFKTYFHRLMRNNEKNSYKFPEQFTFTLWSGCPWNVGKMIFFHYECVMSFRNIIFFYESFSRKLSSVRCACLLDDHTVVFTDFYHEIQNDLL